MSTELENAIQSINTAADRTTKTTEFVDQLSTYDDISDVTNPNTGETVPSLQKKTRLVAEAAFAESETQINQAVSDAELSALAAQSAANYDTEFVVGVTSAIKGKSYLYDGSMWACLSDTTETPAIGNVNWYSLANHNSLTNRDDADAHPASSISMDNGNSVENEVKEVEERLLGPGAKIYRGSNGSYVQDGDVVPVGTTHLAVVINGKVEDVSMSPVASGAVSLLTETGATIGGASVYFERITEMPFVNVKSFGAKGDGVSFDTQAFRLAVATGASKIKVPAGNFVIHDTVNLQSGQTIEGAGIERGGRGTTITYVGSAYAPFNVDATSSAKQHCAIKNMSIVSNWKNDGIGSPVGIRFVGVDVNSINDHHLVSDVRIDGFYIGIEVTGRQIWSSYNRVWIQNCQFGFESYAVSFNLNEFTEMSISYCKETGFRSTGESQALSFRSCNFESNNVEGSAGAIAGVELRNCESPLFSGCYFEDNGAGTAVDNTTPSNNSKALALTGSYVYTPTIESCYIVGSGISIFIDTIRLYGGSLGTSRVNSRSNREVYIEAEPDSLNSQQVPFVVRGDNKFDTSVDFIDIAIDGNGLIPAAVEQNHPYTWIASEDSLNSVDLYRGSKLTCGVPAATTWTMSALTNMHSGMELTIYNQGAGTIEIADALTARNGSVTILSGRIATLQVMGYPTKKLLVTSISDPLG